MADNPNGQPDTVTQMGPTVRGQVWPTYPRQSTAPKTWSVIKFYTAKLDAADTDNVYGQTVPKNIKFDLPVTVLGWNGAVTISDGSGFPVGWDPLSCFRVRFATVGGENINLEPVKASALVGSGRRPGFAWGGGWPFGPGNGLVAEITPLLPGLPDGVTLDIDLVFPCLQTRIGTSANYEAAMSGKPTSSQEL